MATKSVTQPRKLRVAEVTPAAGKMLEAAELARGLHPVQIALSKARAAQDLLAALADADDPVGAAISTVRCNLTDEERSGRLDWIRGFADDALTAALDEAAAEFLKHATKAVA
jgi:hypothetical protein